MALRVLQFGMIFLYTLIFSWHFIEMFIKMIETQIRNLFSDENDENKPRTLNFDNNLV